MRTGAFATAVHSVTDDDTAAALGSGDLAVLATPRLLAWCEAATCAAIADDLTDEQTSVGTRVRLDHLKPTAVAGTVRVTAEVEHVDGRLVRFAVRAEDGDDRLVATGEVTRVVVDRARFAARIPTP